MTEEDDDDALLEFVQRQPIRYFWDFAHPPCGLARERSNLRPEYGLEVVTTGGSGFGIMAIITDVGRGWIYRADSYHGILPHFLHGDTGLSIPFSHKDDGGNLVEDLR